MCTRIFNSLNPSLPMTGRNFDWHNPLTTYLYRLPAGGSTRFGLEGSTAHKRIHTWTAANASICSYLGDDQVGFAAIDGINDKGLVVNGLEDLFAYFKNVTDIVAGDESAPRNAVDMLEADLHTYIDQAEAPEGTTLISSLRWVQFTLDNFSSVSEAANYYKTNPENLFVISEFVPDGKEDTNTKLHLTLSDPSGNSAIVELRGSGFSVTESPNSNVATVTPRYEVQQLLLQPWKKKWQDSDKSKGFNFHSVPGGTATHQRFARAYYFYQFAQPSDSLQGVLSQTRSLMATCATPLSCHFERESADVASATTLWCSISDQTNKCYHLVNSFTLNHQWLGFDDTSLESQRVKLVEGQNDTTVVFAAGINGDLSAELSTCPAPFERY